MQGSGISCHDVLWWRIPWKGHQYARPVLLEKDDILQMELAGPRSFLVPGLGHVLANAQQLVKLYKYEVACCLAHYRWPSLVSVVADKGR